MKMIWSPKSAANAYIDAIQLDGAVVWSNLFPNHPDVVYIVCGEGEGLKIAEMKMVWSPKSAANAYLDTVELCKHEHERNNEPNTPVKPESSEFLSALAAGTSSQLIVEVSSKASKSTIALAAAARQTGGHLVCILPEQKSLEESEKVVNDSGLNEMVEFKVGDPYELISKYENIDFSVVDCKNESNMGLLKMLNMNPRRSVVVANNLAGTNKGLGGDMPHLKETRDVRSVMNPIGNGMEVTLIGKSYGFGIKDANKRVNIGEIRRRHRSKSTWVMKIDEKSGEEHFYRVPKSI